MSSVSTIWFGIVLCAVVASADVQSDVKDIVNQFPWDDEQASNPDDNQPIPHPAVQPSLEELFQVPAVKDLVEYFENHEINAEKVFVGLLKSLHQYHAFAKASSIGEILDVMIKTLSSPEVEAVVHEKMENDPDFAKLAEAVKTPEFKVLFYRALNAKANCAGCNGREVRGFGFSFGISFGK